MKQQDFLGSQWKQQLIGINFIEDSNQPSVQEPFLM